MDFYLARKASKFEAFLFEYLLSSVEVLLFIEKQRLRLDIPTDLCLHNS